jgi:hypothetical protein
MGEQRSEETLERLLYPIVIVNRQGNICFKNGTARHLLPEGLDRRLVSHVRSNPDIRPITQVRFKLQNGHDLILQVRLGEIEWLGERATQVSVWNVTPYLAMIQRLQKELGTQKQALEELGTHRAQAEQELAARVEMLQSELSVSTAERAELRREIAKRESLEKEVATLRQELVAAEEARAEWTEKFEMLKGEARSYADALAHAREEAAQAAGFAETQQAKAAEAEKHAASTAWQLEQVRGELSRRLDEAQVSEKAWAQERAEFQHGAQGSLDQAAAQTAEKLRNLRVKLAVGVHARRVAQEKITQLQREMAGYRQNPQNPVALREAEEQLAEWGRGLTVAEEQVRNLTEELRTAGAADVQQDERVDNLR